MQRPLVSVVIPTYKRPENLNRAVKSVLNQTYGHLEIIIVDDNEGGSVYRKYTEEAMNCYISNPRIKYIKHEKNKGGSAARNTGINNCKGELIAFLDDDDEWLPKKLEKQVDLIKKLPQSVAVVDTGFKIIKNDNIVLVKPSLQGYIFKDLLVKHRGRAPKLSSVLCKKKVLIEVGLFDESLPSRQDLDLYLKVAKKYKFESIFDILVVNYRVSNDRISFSIDKKIQGYDVLYEKYKRDLKKYPILHSIYLKQHGELLVKKGKVDEAREKFRLSIIKNPLNVRSYLLFILSLFCNSDSYVKIRSKQVHLKKRVLRKKLK